MTGKQKATTTTTAAPRRARATRRTVALSPDPLDTLPVEELPPVTKTRPTTRRTRAKAPAEPAQPVPAEPVQPEPVVTELPTVNPDAKVGEEYPGEPVFKMTVNIPVSLHQRASGVVRYAEFTGELAEIESLTDLVRNSLAEIVDKYEKKYNDGNPFPTPKRLRRGRRSTSS